MASITASCLRVAAFVAAPAKAQRHASVAVPVRAIAAKRSMRTSIVAQAQKSEMQVSRRDVALVGLAALAALQPAPAKAFLGFGEGAANTVENYTAETEAVLNEVTAVLALEKGDPTKDEKITALRGSINTWVAKYRRDDSFSGKPSFGNTYTVLNALAGHYNNFGTDYPLPKKRLDRVVKEVDDARKFLARGR